MEGHVEIRRLWAGDGPACDAIVASLPYHFGNQEGRAEAPARCGPIRGWWRWWTAPWPGS
jgi:hypothetical protein